MATKAAILADLRASMAAIERGEGSGAFVADSSCGDRRAARGDAEDTGGTAGTRGAGCTAAPAAIGAAGGQRASDASSCELQGDRHGGSERTGEAAFRKILRWVSVRERSSVYVRERLAKDEFPPEAIDEALDRAVRVHAVDDRRYSDALIRMKLAAGKGLRAAEAEIIGLGIDPSTLDAWQEHAERGRDAEVQRALALLRRRPPRAKQAREAAFRKLVGQGFSTDIASSAARLWSEEHFADIGTL